MSQEQRILSYLQRGHVLNPLQALDKFGTMRLAARIWALRMAGWDIRTRRLTTRTGKRIAIYYSAPK
jgi:hypothetical protein